MSPLEIVKLTSLMQRTGGRAEIAIGPIDGPIAINHPDLASQKIHEIPGRLPGLGTQEQSAACRQGTFTVVFLSARRDSPVLVICPNCALLGCPIFSETTSGNGQIPSATPEELAAAIVESAAAGAHVLNLSVALVQLSFIKGKENQKKLKIIL